MVDSLIFLAWGMLTSFTLVDVYYRLLEEKVVGCAQILFVMIDFASALNMALIVVLLLYLIRWYLLIRIDHLSRQTNAL
jgi:hypothetical protein